MPNDLYESWIAAADAACGRWIASKWNLCERSEPEPEPEPERHWYNDRFDMLEEEIWEDLA